MTDQRISTAFEKLLHLHSSSGEAVGQFSAIGAIRQVIFRPGSVIFGAYEKDAREARDAVKLLGDPKATALVNEIVNLAQRMIQLEAALPPVRPYIVDFRTGELNLAGVALYLGSGTLWNYLVGATQQTQLNGKTRYVLSQSELMKWCKWNGTNGTNGANYEDVEVVVEKVTRHLASLVHVA
jgi:hypothetical protein